MTLLLTLAFAIFPFQVSQPAEVVAEIEMTSAGADWAVPGREAAMADVTVDGKINQQVMLFAGAASHSYPVFLGKLEAGWHELRVDRNAAQSAPGTGLSVPGVKFRETNDPGVAYAPILYERRNAVGKFTDVPLFAYVEALNENGQRLLQYTIIFSNEDGGTSTRALMARWGRTTDIEYVYRIFLDAQGRASRATIQGRDHKELPFNGPTEGTHPVLMPVTDNNMVSGEATSAVRYQPAPVRADLSESPREQVMDDHPFTFGVMVKELIRERKLRAFGTVDGEKISDPRNYLSIDAKVRNQRSRTAAMVRLRGDSRWRMSNLGRLDFAIERDGWVRTTVELPPGTRAEQIGEIGFQCLAADKEKQAGLCTVQAVKKVFLLGDNLQPSPSLWSLPAAAVEIPTGEVMTWTLK